MKQEKQNHESGVLETQDLTNRNPKSKVIIGITNLINKRWKEHKEDRDGDGFACCPIRQQFETRVASKLKWYGNEESRQQALKDQEFMDKNISCDFCSLCSELIGIRT